MLICRSNNDPETTNNDQLLKWCCKNGFELVDLSETKDPEDEGDLKMLENIGFNRFVEILDTRSWSSIRFKDEQDDLGQPNTTSDLRSEIRQDNLVDSYFKELTLDENGKSTADLDEKKLTFEELFSQIREFKGKHPI